MSKAISVKEVVACRLLALAFNCLQMDKSDEQWCGNLVAQFFHDQEISEKQLFVFVTAICCSKIGRYLKYLRKCFLECVDDRNRAGVISTVQQAGDLLPEIYDNPYLSAGDVIALNQHLENEYVVVRSLASMISIDYELNDFNVDILQEMIEECRNCNCTVTAKDKICGIINSAVYCGPIHIVDYEPLTDKNAVFVFEEDELVYYLTTTGINRYTGQSFKDLTHLRNRYRIPMAMTKCFLEMSLLE